MKNPEFSMYSSEHFRGCARPAKFLAVIVAYALFPLCSGFAQAPSERVLSIPPHIRNALTSLAKSQSPRIRSQTPWDEVIDNYLPLADERLLALVTAEEVPAPDAAPGPTPPIVVDNWALPDCTKPHVHLKEVFVHTPGSEKLDVIYFNPKNAGQAERVKGLSGNVIPYEPVMVVDQVNPEVDDWQLFARRAGIRCLPTHFRFTYIGSRRYMEYREGEKAFDSVSSQAQPQPVQPTSSPL
jgi:hypothetical protein